MLKIRQCEGNGQGTCALCEKRGKWNRAWMNFLYKVDGVEGCYCYKCAKEVLAREIERGKQ